MGVNFYTWAIDDKRLIGMFFFNVSPTKNDRRGVVVWASIYKTNERCSPMLSNQERRRWVSSLGINAPYGYAIEKGHAIEKFRFLTARCMEGEACGPFCPCHCLCGNELQGETAGHS